MRNPYSPPISSNLDAPSEVVSRPFAVWLLLFILLAAEALFAYAFIRSIWLVGPRLSEVSNPLGLAQSVILRLIYFVALLAIMTSIFQRKRWSRWLGLVVIASFLIGNFLRADNTHYLNEAQAAGGFVGRFVIVPLLLSWWAYAFAFSSKAKRYFISANAA